MKKLFVLAVMAVGLAGPVLAWSGADQDGSRVEVDPNQAILPGREIEFQQDGERRTLSVESVRPFGGRIRIEGTDEDGDPVTLDMERQDRRDADDPAEED